MKNTTKDSLLNLLPTYLSMKMDKLGRQQKEVAELSDFHVTEISRIVNGHVPNITVPRLEKLLYGIDSDIEKMCAWRRRRNSRTR